MSLSYNVIYTEQQGKYLGDILLFFLPVGWQLGCCSLSAPGGVRPGEVPGADRVRPLPAAICGNVALPIPAIIW